MTRVAMFLEGEFQEVREFASADIARAFSEGVEAGAACCAGGLMAMVWPDQEDEIRELDAAQGKGVLAALGVLP